MVEVKAAAQRRPGRTTWPFLQAGADAVHPACGSSVRGERRRGMRVQCRPRRCRHAARSRIEVGVRARQWRQKLRSGSWRRSPISCCVWGSTCSPTIHAGNISNTVQVEPLRRSESYDCFDTPSFLLRPRSDRMVLRPSRLQSGVPPVGGTPASASERQLTCGSAREHQWYGYGPECCAPEPCSRVSSLRHACPFRDGGLPDDDGGRQPRDGLPHCDDVRSMGA